MKPADADLLWPPLFLLHLEGADRALREGTRIRLSRHRARPAAAYGGAARALADRQVPAPRRRRAGAVRGDDHHRISPPARARTRPEARRVGKECVRTCNTRW